MAGVIRVSRLLRTTILFAILAAWPPKPSAQGVPVELKTGMEVDVDGAPNAYGPPACNSLDDERNAHFQGRPDGAIVGYVLKYGQPFLQGPTDPAPGCYVSTTAFFDPSNSKDEDPNKYLDATRVNYVVLSKLAQDHHVRLGDLVAVWNSRTGKSVFGIVGDSGNPSGAEGSLALLRALGYHVRDGRSGGISKKEITIRYFPGSNPNREFLNTQEKIDARAKKLSLNGRFGS